MPTYVYACTDCGHTFEVHQSFSDNALTTCPNCSGKLRKVFNSVGIVFKGSGFYRTDSRAAAKSEPGKQAADASSSSNGSGSSDSSSSSGNSAPSGTSANGSSSSGSSSSAGSSSSGSSSSAGSSSSGSSGQSSSKPSSSGSAA